MNFFDFKTALANFPVFSLHDVRTVDPAFDRRRLTEWQCKGYVRKVAKGCYLFTGVKVDELTLFRVANKLYRPSYVSIETALAFYGLIPEAVYGVTSVSTRRTYGFNTPLTQFTYRTIATRMFFGYSAVNDGIKLAHPEKAILDLLYLNPRLTTEADFASLRVNPDTFADMVDRDRLQRYLVRFAKASLTKRTERLLKCIANA